MKNFSILISIFFYSISIQAQTYVNHFSFEGPVQDPTVYKFDILPNGNIIVPAIVDKDFSCFPGAINIYQETVVKNPGSVITCLSPSNAVLWTKKWFPENYMNDYFYIFDAIHDTIGNIYLAARYGGKVDVDPGPSVLFFQPDSINSTELCIIKLDSVGQFIWAKKIDDIVVTAGASVMDVNFIFINQMQWLPNGNVSLLGYFSGTYDFDPGSGTSILTTIDLSHQNGFALELDPGFNFVSVKQLKGNRCSLNSMYTDNSNHHYIIYNYEDTLDLNFNTATNIQISQGQFGNSGIAKFDANYNLLWSKSIDTNLYPVCITPYPNGGIYLLSNYSGPTVLNNGTAVTAAGSGDISVDKFNLNGNVQWSQTIAGDSNNYSLDLKYHNNELLLLHTNDGGTNFSTGLPSSINTSNINMVLSKFDTSFVHISSGIFQSNTDNYNLYSQIGFSNNQAILKMYFYGSGDLDPSAGTVNFTPAYTSNHPAVFVRLDLQNSSTSLPSLHTNEKLIIYPNPTTGNLFIKNQETDYSIKIINSIGQEVYHENCRSKKSVHDVGDLPSGLYIITLQNNTNVLSNIFQKL